MSDIVEKLKGQAVVAGRFKDRSAGLMVSDALDAADEIERLRAGYERLERILTKQSLAADERSSDALAFVRYINTSRAALKTGE